MAELPELRVGSARLPKRLPQSLKQLFLTFYVYNTSAKQVQQDLGLDDVVALNIL